MAIPDAVISHQIPGRIRIRIPSQKDNATYFSDLGKAFSNLSGIEKVKVNHLTASVLFTGKAVEAGTIAEHGIKTNSFSLFETAPQKRTLPQKATEPINSLNKCFNQLTSGEVDFFGILFLMLIITGALQILRGNLRIPPWYTAYWYAFGLFRNLLGNRNKN